MSPPSGTDQATYAPLTRRDKFGLAVFVFIIIAFACQVEMRSAFLTRRMTDADVYFRTAWAARTGGDLYRIADDNGWHYNYPPLLAILLEPLADAPAGEARDGLLPYSVAAAIWLLFNLLCTAVAVHWLASTLERASPDPRQQHLPLGCREWWAHRMVPLLICLPPIAHTLMRGQVNLLLLLLIAGMLRAIVRGRNAQGGIWLAGAICIKIIPAFLLLIPAWRRDWRYFGGATLGLIFGLAVIPVIAFGTERTIECYLGLADGVLRPGLTHDGDPTRANELTNVTGTGSQSFLVIAHNTMHPNRSTRPVHAEAWLRFTALAAGGLLALITLLAAQKRLRQPGINPAAETFVAWGALTMVMLFTSPISHMHYQCLCLPLVMGLLVLWPPTGWNRLGWLALTVFFYAAQILPHFATTSVTRDFGMPLYAGLMMWLLGVVTLALGKSETNFETQQPALDRAAA